MQKFFKTTRYYSLLISRENFFSLIAFSGILMGIFQILEYSQDTENSFIFLKVNYILWSAIPTALSIFLLGFTIKQYGIPASFGYVLGIILVLLPLPSAIQIGAGETIRPYLLFGSIPITGIEGSILSVILTGIFIGLINRHKKDRINILTSLFIGAVFNILIFEPLCFIITSWLIISIKELLLLPNFFIALVMNTLLPLFLLLGGRIFIPFISRIYISQYEMNLYSSLLSFTYFTWAGIALAFFAFQNKPQDKTNSLLVSLCAFFGLGIPFILGYLFRYPSLFLISILGGLLGFFWVTFFEIKTWTIAYYGIPLFLFYNGNQKLIFIIGSAFILSISFLMTFYFLKKLKKKEKTLTF